MGSFEQFDEFYQAAFARLVGQLFLVTGDLQVAEQLRLPAATVRGRLARARAGLRDQLSPALEEPEEEVRPRHG
jgi:hypothetical protein